MPETTRTSGSFSDRSSSRASEPFPDRLPGRFSSRLSGPLSRRDDFPLLAACVAFALLSCVVVPLTLSLGWDESVYASRFQPYAPATPFSAPRTRGVPLLIAPVASWSESVVLLRLWLTLLSTAALYLGFRPWLRVLAHRPAAVGVAAMLYGSLWFALFYANSAMPNHYTAMGITAAVGLFTWASPGRLALTGIAAGLAVAVLMRPNDGAAAAFPLLVAALLVPAWRTRRRERVLAVACGVLAGLLPWVVEAYVRFGGVRERLTDASDVQGGLRPLAAVAAQFTALDGPLLCRPCDADRLGVAALEWWILLPALVAAGLWATRRAARASATPQQAARRPALWLAVAAAVAAALPYLLLVPYGAPRFLLPTHALLALPAAIGALALADRAKRALTPTALPSVLPSVLLASLLVAHLAFQLPRSLDNTRIQTSARADWSRINDVLYAQGVRAPCVLKGNTSVIPIAHVSGCTAAHRGDRRQPTALVLRKKEPPHWARDWRRHPVPDTYAPGWTVLVPPTTAPPAAPLTGPPTGPPTALRNTATDMRS